METIKKVELIPNKEDVISHINKYNFIKSFSFTVESTNNLFKILMNTAMIKMFTKNQTVTDLHLRNKMSSKAHLLAELSRGNAIKMVWIAQIMYQELLISEISRSLSYETNSFKGKKITPYLEGLETSFTESFKLLVYRRGAVSKSYNSNNREIVLDSYIELCTKDAIGYINTSHYLSNPNTSLDEVQEVIRRIENGR